MKQHERITCFRCDGHGIVDSGYHHPDECPDCGGAGTIVRYESGAYAKYPGGPLLGRNTKEDVK